MSESERITNQLLDDILVTQVLNLAFHLRQWNIETGAALATDLPSAFIRSALRAIHENRDEILSMWRDARPHD